MAPVKHSGRTETLVIRPPTFSSGLSRMRRICRRLFGRSLTTHRPPLNKPLRRLFLRQTSLSPRRGNTKTRTLPAGRLVGGPPGGAAPKNFFRPPHPPRGHPPP